MQDAIRFERYTIPVLYEDNHLLAVVKPPNMPVQADRSGDGDLLNALKAYIGEKYAKPGSVYLGLVHRLDRPVGGAMIFARTSKAASRLSAAFAKHTQKRVYLAVLEGVPEGPTEMRDWLLKDPATGMVRVVPEGAEGARLALLRSQPLAVSEGRTLVQVQLFTGRSHQIRVQHASRGLPIWGDARYGVGKPGQQIALWAAMLDLEHPVRKTPLRLVSLPPDEGAWRAFPEALRLAGEHLSDGDPSQ
ncbi:MAG: RluA family pseudouridine synthase [Clostridia bacterium]|nr:RluA family pseudouridine synthase [Clostridia bacterium]